MKVAIDVGSMEGHDIRGIGVHTSELLKEINKSSKKVDGLDFAKADLSKYDVVHYPYFSSYFQTLPSKKLSKKLVVTIHDLIPLIYKEHYPPGIKGRIAFLKQKFRLKNADAIITISETSKKDICRFLRVSPSIVHVIYLAPRHIFKPITAETRKNEVRSKYKLPKKFILYVGDVNYNKNIPGLIRAARASNIPVVMVGKSALRIEELARANHAEQTHLKDIVRDLGSDLVIRLGFVPDDDLVTIFSLASVYCQPSFYEGFGFPVLEAQACGCPVVASSIQAHKEIASDSCLFANPKDPKDLANKITEVVGSKAVSDSLIKKGKENASKYSWEKTARETLQVYRDLLNE